MNDVKEQFLSGMQIKNRWGLSTQTLHRWANDERVKTLRTPGGKRLYSLQDFEKIFKVPGSDKPSGGKICYARVSSKKQEPDLARQIETLHNAYPNHELIKDIGSGLNFKRPGFISILGRLHRGEIAEIVVLYKDRLCRFGYEIVEFLCEQSNCKIVVHNPANKAELNDSEELAEDLLSIVTVFVARNNGRRAAKNRKMRKDAEESGDKGSNSEGSEGNNSDEEEGRGNNSKKEITTTITKIKSIKGKGSNKGGKGSNNDSRGSEETSKKEVICPSNPVKSSRSSKTTSAKNKSLPQPKTTKVVKPVDRDDEMDL